MKKHEQGIAYILEEEERRERRGASEANIVIRDAMRCDVRNQDQNQNGKIEKKVRRRKKASFFSQSGSQPPLVKMIAHFSLFLSLSPQTTDLACKKNKTVLTTLFHLLFGAIWGVSLSAFATWARPI